MRAQMTHRQGIIQADAIPGGGLENRRHRPAIPATGKSRNEGEYSSGIQQPRYMQADADGRIRMHDLLKQLIRTRLPVTTDQKVRDSSPSERAPYPQVRAIFSE
jgi:hypothetical protein